MILVLSKQTGNQGSARGSVRHAARRYGINIWGAAGEIKSLDENRYSDTIASSAKKQRKILNQCRLESNPRHSRMTACIISWHFSGCILALLRS